MSTSPFQHNFMGLMIAWTFLGAANDPGDSLLTWVRIPAGSFIMGCSENDRDCDHTGEGYYETPRHQVAVSAFEMTETEITQAQYMAMTGTNPSSFKDCGGDCPVEHLPNYWHDAAAFCAAVGGRLPTEAEWEYAARAGTTKRYYCGDDEVCLDDIAWHRGNSDGTPHPVGLKTPNALGLYDMLGNVMEYTAECMHADYTGAPVGGGVFSGGDCGTHVFRGGGFNDDEKYQRVSNRYWDSQDMPGIADGFRCVRDVHELSE